MTSQILVESFIPVEEVRLGALVCEPLSPNIHAFAYELPRSTKDVIVTKMRKITVKLSGSKQISFWSAMTGLFKSKIKTSGKFSMRLSAAHSLTAELPEPQPVFQDLCKLPSVRLGLESGRKRPYKYYLVTGYRTMKDAQFEVERSSYVETSVEFSIPVHLLAGGGGAAMPFLGSRWISRLA